MPLLCHRRQGLYCPEGDFYIDPVRKVPRAVITHGHADHARPGHGDVLATPETVAVMQARLGIKRSGRTQGLGYRQVLRINGVSMQLLPAGHCFGSAQVLIEKDGERAIVSGDYKRRPDPTCPPFEAEEADLFVTEATFGMPIYRHPDARGEVAKILHSLRVFPDRPHVVQAYSLGKAQRLIALLRQQGYQEPIYLSPAVRSLCDLYERFGCDLGELLDFETASAADLSGKLAFVPPASLRQPGFKFSEVPVTIYASGWMRTQARRRSPAITLPLIISDHADWDELTATLIDVRAGEIWITHGEEQALLDFCRAHGLCGKALRMLGYGDPDEAMPESAH